MSKNGLNPKQERFCTEYASNGGNATEAYKAAYEQEDVKTAAANGSRMIRNDKVLKRIRQLQDEAAAPRIASLVQAKSVLSEIMLSPTQKPSDRIRAAEVLLRAGGAFVRVKEDDTGFSVVTTPRDRADAWSDVILYDPRKGQPEPPDDDGDGSTVIYLPIRDHLEDHEPDDIDDEREIGG